MSIIRWVVVGFICLTLLVGGGVGLAYIFAFDHKAIAECLKNLLGEISISSIFLNILVFGVAVAFCHLRAFHGIVNACQRKLGENCRIVITAFILILLSIICFFFQAHLALDEKIIVKIGANDGIASLSTNQFSWAYVFNIFGSSFAIAGIFSVLLGFSDFVNFVSTQLRQIVISHEFIRKLTPFEKKRLRLTVDRDVYGKNVTTDQYGLYPFLMERLENILTTPYREDFHDKYMLHEIADNTDYWDCYNDTSYNLCFEHLTAEKVVIGYGGSSIVISPNTMMLSDYFKELKISIDGVDFELASDVNKRSYEWRRKLAVDVEHVLSVPLAEGHLAKSWVPRRLLLKVKARKVKNQYVVDYSVDIDILRKKAPKQRLYIAIQKRKLMSKIDSLFVCSMVYPTKDVYLDCCVHGSSKAYHFTGTAFTLKPENVRISSGHDSCIVQVREWMFSGHGASISWC